VLVKSLFLEDVRIVINYWRDLSQIGDITTPTASHNNKLSIRAKNTQNLYEANAIRFGIRPQELKD